MADIRVVILDYGLGNVGSVLNMVRKVGVSSVQISADPAQIHNATHLILPGVGAFDTGMQNLANSGLIPILQEVVIEKKTPILGICLGMQLMCAGSEEGQLAGLGWVQQECLRFKPTNGLKVPHMGWNYVSRAQAESAILNERFYFVHSYYLPISDTVPVWFTANYDIKFAAGFKSAHIWGAQFHPEKSHHFGKQLMSEFLAFTA